jgi:hypothetical protein
MEEIELTPEQIDGINKLARFIRDYTEEEQSPNTRRRPRCPSCDDGLHRNWKQLEQEEDKDEPPEK